MATKDFEQQSDHDSKKDHKKEPNDKERSVDELGGDRLKENDLRYSTPTNKEEE